MITKLISLSALAVVSVIGTAPAAIANTTHKYTEMCWYLGNQNHPWIEKATCAVDETRDKRGFMVRRVINVVPFVSYMGRTVRYTVVEGQGPNGFQTWDSDRKHWYNNSYSVAKPPAETFKESGLPAGHGITAVTKELWMRQISWD